MNINHSRGEFNSNPDPSPTQTCQLSRTGRGSHDFLHFLLVSRRQLCISRFFLFFKDTENFADLSFKMLSLVPQVSSYLTVYEHLDTLLCFPVIFASSRMGS